MGPRSLSVSRVDDIDVENLNKNRSDYISRLILSMSKILFQIDTPKIPEIPRQTRDSWSNKSLVDIVWVLTSRSFKKHSQVTSPKQLEHNQRQPSNGNWATVTKQQ